MVSTRVAAWNRCDDRREPPEPREHELRRRAAELAREAAQLLRRPLHARRSAERTMREHPDPVLGTRRDEAAVNRIDAPWVELHLDRRDRCDRTRLGELRRRHVRQPIARTTPSARSFASARTLVASEDLRIDGVQEIQIDRLHPEAIATRTRGLRQMARAPRPASTHRPVARARPS